MKICAVVLEDKTIVHSDAVTSRRRAVSSRHKAQGSRQLETKYQKITLQFGNLLTAHGLLPTAYCLLPSVFRLPGFMTASPRLQASHWEAETAGTSSVASENTGTPTSAFPPDRSMIEAAAITSAPASRRALIVSRVEPPVVITSSTTRTRSVF